MSRDPRIVSVALLLLSEPHCISPSPLCIDAGCRGHYGRCELIVVHECSTDIIEGIITSLQHQTKLTHPACRAQLRQKGYNVKGIAIEPRETPWSVISANWIV